MVAANVCTETPVMLNHVFKDIYDTYCDPTNSDAYLNNGRKRAKYTMLKFIMHEILCNLRGFSKYMIDKYNMKNNLLNMSWESTREYHKVEKFLTTPEIVKLIIHYLKKNRHFFNYYVKEHEIEDYFYEIFEKYYAAMGITNPFDEDDEDAEDAEDENMEDEEDENIVIYMKDKPQKITCKNSSGQTCVVHLSVEFP